jgi:hypothetical protein
LRLCPWGANISENEGQEFEDAIHEGCWSILGFVMWTFFVWFVEQAGGASAQLTRFVAVFGHDEEICVYEMYAFLLEGV